MIRIGVISDTHGHLDPAVLRLFRGVDHILHGGDIGTQCVISELESIAPVTAVLGNTDIGIGVRETEIIPLAGKKFLVHHVVDIMAPAEVLKRRITSERPDVVVFGHTHRRFCQTLEQTLYFNPGYAGKPRFKLPRSVAILTCDQNGITAEFLEL